MKLNKVKLQYLIIGVALLAFILTSIVSIWSGYRSTKVNLAENALENNRVYAQKVASTANNYLEEQVKLLSANVDDIVTNIDNLEYLKYKSDLIRNQTSAFNSIAIVDAKSVVLATSPQSLDLIGVKLTSEAMAIANREKTVRISQPYESISGRLIIFISIPLFTHDNHYIGLIGGTIYLKEKNVLSELLGIHPYDDGSTVYVADEGGMIIYDEIEENIGTDASENPIVKQALKLKKTDVTEGLNNENEEAFAGFSYVEQADWAVIAQRPADVVDAPAANMVKKMLTIAIPLLLISLIIVIYAAYKIAKPLQRLAELTEKSKSNDEGKNLQTVPAWYYEAIQLKESLIISFGFLHNRVHDLTDQSQTDALTGLYNRRTINDVMHQWTTEQKNYSIILFDVDHFKSVNDTYGHDVGDEVLKFIALLMKQRVRQTDLCCRFGGEEFVILMPNTSVKFAYELAESLRLDFERTNSPTGKPINISAGVAEYPMDATDEVSMIKKVDTLLYEAKNSGRNNVKMKNS